MEDQFDLRSVQPRLTKWLIRRGLPSDRLQPLQGDVSERRYYRLLLGHESVIIACYPVGMREAFSRFRTTTCLLEDARIPVPAILACDLEEGFMLLEDLGDETLFDRREEGWETLRPYLRAAMDIISRLRRLPVEEVRRLNPTLGAEVLTKEIELAWDVFLQPRGLCGVGSDRRRFREGLEELCWRLGQVEALPCHRDFMARNLVPRGPGGGLVVLDHQDLRLGPPAYDVASLTNDSLFPPDEIINELLGEESPDRLLYHRCAAQRTMKVIGTFVSFADRGHPRHLELVPSSLERCLFHLKKLPELSHLAPRLDRWWGPTLAAS